MTIFLLNCDITEDTYVNHSEKVHCRVKEEIKKCLAFDTMCLSFLLLVSGFINALKLCVYFQSGVSPQRAAEWWRCLIEKLLWLAFLPSALLLRAVSLQGLSPLVCPVCLVRWLLDMLQITLCIFDNKHTLTQLISWLDWMYRVLGNGYQGIVLAAWPIMPLIWANCSWRFFLCMSNRATKIS